MATNKQEEEIVTAAAATEAAKPGRKRIEKIGVVASDKMTLTVTVRVDRQVKHPVYRKYVKKRKKFMAHNDLEAKVETQVRRDRFELTMTLPVEKRA